VIRLTRKETKELIFHIKAEKLRLTSVEVREMHMKEAYQKFLTEDSIR
jgi:hypothetical protein